jgi:hypothetical protein
MKMHVINLEDWKFGGDQSRNKIWTKNSLSRLGDFSSKFRPSKSQVLRFGRDLAAV